MQTTLVHVCADPKPWIPASALATASEHLAAEESDWRRQLDNLRAYGSDRAPVDCWVERGHPAGALIDAATATEADVILIGSSGVGTLRGELLGSVSSQLVEHAPCSVMVFREGYPASPAHLRSVLVGLDGSRSSLDALAMAQELAAPLEARLVLCAAYPAGVAFAPPTGELRDEPRVHASRSSTRRDGPCRANQRSSRSSAKAEHERPAASMRAPRTRGTRPRQPRTPRVQALAARQHLTVAGQPRAVPGAHRPPPIVSLGPWVCGDRSSPATSWLRGRKRCRASPGRRLRSCPSGAS